MGLLQKVSRLWMVGPSSLSALAIMQVHFVEPGRHQGAGSDSYPPSRGISLSALNISTDHRTSLFVR